MMHRILVAQKRVPKVRSLCFSQTYSEGSCFTGQDSAVVFSNHTSSKRFVTFSQVGTYAKRANNRIRILSDYYGTDLSIISTAKFSTLKTEKNSADHDTNSEAEGKGVDYNTEFGVWDNRIDLPIMMEASIKQGAPIPRIVASDVGCASILGKRPYQEDR